MWNFIEGSKPVEDPFTIMCQLAAMHCGEIMSQDAPAKFGCSIGETVYHVTIEPSGHEKVWDQVWIALPSDQGKGTLCGNRCGGRDTLAALYADEIRKAATKLSQPMAAK